jgi:predicted transcriptional regulator
MDEVSERVRWDAVTSIRLPPDLQDRIDEVARRQLESRSGLIRRTLAVAYPPEPVK